MIKRITNAELERRVRGYLARGDVYRYSLGEEGRYKITGGSKFGSGYTDRVLDIVQGRFIDALVWAVQLKGFWSELSSLATPNDSEHGQIKIDRKYEVDRQQGNVLLKRLKEKGK